MLRDLDSKSLKIYGNVDLRVACGAPGGRYYIREDLFAPQNHSGIHLFRRKRVFSQSRLRVQRLLNVPISVVDVMGEEGCSLRNHGDNTTSLGLHPFVKRSRRKKRKVLMGLPGHSFHSENTGLRNLRSPASFRDYIKSCEKCSQQKPSTLFDVLSMFSLQ